MTVILSTEQDITQYLRRLFQYSRRAGIFPSWHNESSILLECKASPVTMGMALGSAMGQYPVDSALLCHRGDGTVPSLVHAVKRSIEETRPAVYPDMMVPTTLPESEIVHATIYDLLNDLAGLFAWHRISVVMFPKTPLNQERGGELRTYIEDLLSYLSDSTDYSLARGVFVEQLYRQALTMSQLQILEKKFKHYYVCNLAMPLVHALPQKDCFAAISAILDTNEKD